MMSKAVFILLCLVIQAHPQTPESDDFSGEIDYAGFGTEKPTVSYEDMDDLVSPPFISNETVPIIYEEAENTTYDSNTEPMVTTEDDDETTLYTRIPINTITTADTTEAYPTTTPLETTTEPITTAAPTTITTILTTTHAPTTSERTTTKVPTTTTKLPTTTARATTKKFTTTTKGTKAPTTHLTKPFLTTTARPSTTTSAPFEFPDPKAPQCSFMDVDFFCKDPIVCYGEGEIDCTETFEEMIPEATITISKSTSESDSSDFSDYEESEAETIEYPPELVGRVSPKHKPFLFKMQEFDTTIPSVSESDDKDDSSSNTKTTIHITIANGDGVSDSSTSKAVLSMPSDESTTSSSVSSMATQTQIIIRTETSSDSDKFEFDTKPISGTTESTSISSFFTEVEGNHVLTTTKQRQNDSEVTPKSAALVNVTESEEFSAAFIDDSSETTTKKAHLINKRSENKILSSGSESSSSSMSLSLRVAALESPNQKIRVGRCRITGTMYCTPSPTVGNCRGRTLCQVVSSTAETSEKSTSAKGVENWAIAVIAICAIAAALTVSLLIYLVFTSWKKLKVQPHSGVTTLNYVNNTPP